MTTAGPLPGLQRLARLYGVQTAHYDMAHQRHQASPDSLLAVLKSLGAPLAGFPDVRSALRECEQALWLTPLDCVTVAWDGNLPPLSIRLPAHLGDRSLPIHLSFETGDRRGWGCRVDDLPTQQAAEIEGVRYVTKLLHVPEELPAGYHKLALELPGKPAESLVISAPSRAYSVEDNRRNGRFWGVFLPLYSLHTRRSWGAGDLLDLELLTDWISSMGGGLVATLPLLPAFLDQPFEPSPYMPVSRLMWNEFYANADQTAEVKDVFSSFSFKQEIEGIRGSPVVDYRRQMLVKRSVLEQLARSCFDQGGDGLEQIERFTKANPLVEDYARFRAACEHEGVTWMSWPQRQRSGSLGERDYDVDVQRYYVYTQWLLDQQIRALSEKARRHGPGLCLDFPLGVHPSGYDVWRYQDLFLRDVSVGAPPDPVFTCGQDWGFPPEHPGKLRHRGYDYYISSLRHHLRYAGMLRIDHVMGLHRLFMIPHGMEPCHGVYVHYHPEELYGILCLESNRAKCAIVGEDLGTVPPSVRPSMRRHGLYRSYVVQYELSTDHQKRLRAAPRNAVASVNTHDMPPFAAFWHGLDIEERVRLKLLDRRTARAELDSREAVKRGLKRSLRRRGWLDQQGLPPDRAILVSVLRFLSASRAQVVLVNLEDLWLETEPQNVPGTQEENPNWRRKARYDLETLRRMPEVVNALREVDRIRSVGVGNDTKRY